MKSAGKFGQQLDPVTPALRIDPICCGEGVEDMVVEIAELQGVQKQRDKFHMEPGQHAEGGGADDV